MKKVHGFKPLDEKAKARLKALTELPDSEINTSDIPELTEDFFENAIPFNEVYKPKKQQITTRIDADILLWLRSHGKGYQTLMNNLLRKEMIEEKKKLAH